MTADISQGVNTFPSSVGCWLRQQEDLRGSVQVELVAGLDVEHEISSVQILHHKEEVLLEKNKMAS